MAITEKAKSLNKEHNRIATAKAQGIDPELKAKLLNDINSGRGNVSRSGVFSLGGDIKDLALVTRQVRLYSGIVLELGGNASPAEVDKFAETSTGILFWGKANGDAYEQTPSKIMFGTYFKQTIGEVEWSKSKGKLEILRYSSKS
jgi:hypothetical protein|tara:strand:+ start:210 stop:644 length:435 start_codon:yes stop_codon:yes gene_type:complete